jgi:hypothetical protein
VRLGTEAMPKTIRDTIITVQAEMLADLETAQENIAASHSLTESSRPPTKPKAERVTEIKAALTNQLEQAIAAGVLESPFSDIRVIHAETGDCFDGDGVYLLTLALSGIQDIVRLADQVQVHSTDGRILQEKNR